MITFDEMIVKLAEVEEDVSYWVDENNEDFGIVIHATVEDFDGFDEHWCEVFRDYVDEEKVDAFLEMLAEECERCEADLYKDYFFDGFMVELGFGSFDI